ncbi:E3 ubiquitin-protein ligase bre1 [Ascosphaera acerosa]|nr:E3 ubiquitin-protein ligase bre1 [Ascosphaera acerosa]
MPWRDDLERVQKDAILRQMHEYKRERNTLEARVKELEKSAAFHDEHLRVIDAWLKQLIDEVRVMLHHTTDMPSDQGDSSASTFPTSLLHASPLDFEKHLQDRAESIKALVSTLLSRAPQPPPDVSELQAQITRLLGEQKATQVALEQSIAEKQSLEERLDAASLRYMVAEKKIDRARSITVAKLEKQEILGSQRKPSAAGGAGVAGAGAGGAGGSPAGVSPGVPGAGAKAGATANGAGAADQERLRELQSLHSQSKAVVEKQKVQLKKLEDENLKLFNQVTELNVKVGPSPFTKFSDDDYAQTDLFKHLKSQHADVIKRINHLEAVNVQLREEAQKLQAERTAYRMEIEAESQAVMAEKEAQITRLESDLTRVRHARDELLADQSVKKAVLDQDRAATAQSKELLEARDARIAALESEVERLQVRIDGLKGEGSSAPPPTSDSSDATADGSDALDVPTLRANYKSLDKQYAMLNQEVSSMQQAFRKASKLAGQRLAEARAQEEKVQRFAAEKAKADQKYFAAMKSKETREHELMALRLQNAKSSDIIAQLKDAETSTRSLLSNVEKQLAETREALNAATSQSNAAQRQASEAAVTVQGLQAQVVELKKVASSRDSSLAAAQSAARSHEREVEELKVAIADAKKHVESLRASRSSSRDQSTEAEMLRTLAVCTVCRQNFKNTVIKTCGHVFCQDCVEERLTSRSRKCPNCNRSFGNNDYMRITL